MVFDILYNIQQSREGSLSPISLKFSITESSSVLLAVVAVVAAGLDLVAVAGTGKHLDPYTMVAAVVAAVVVEVEAVVAVVDPATYPAH